MNAKPAQKWKTWHKVFISIVAVFIFLMFIVTRNAKDAPKSEPQSISTTKLQTDSALAAVRKEKSVKEAIVTEANVLYVSVYDDGTSRKGFAEYLCQLLADYHTNIIRVKVVKFGSTTDPKRDNAFGVLLGESYCK